MTSDDLLTRKPFIFLRHGATDWLKQRRVQGQSDVALNEEGMAQARAARDRLLRGGAIATICCSPLRRAVATAQIINEALGLHIAVIDDLRECGLGVMEGTLSAELPPHWLKTRPVTGAETYDAFIARALNGLNLALARPGPVLIVSHGGVYWAVQVHAGLDKSANIPPCVPVYHEPPSTAPGWQVNEIG